MPFKEFGIFTAGGHKEVCYLPKMTVKGMVRK
jgi:hypothetical protein